MREPVPKTDAGTHQSGGLSRDSPPVFNLKSNTMKKHSAKYSNYNSKTPGCPNGSADVLLLTIFNRWSDGHIDDNPSGFCNFTKSNQSLKNLTKL